MGIDWTFLLCFFNNSTMKEILLTKVILARILWLYFIT